MARNTDAKCRLCRRSGEKLFLKGDRCFSQKCAMTRKPYIPGMHGQKMRRNMSEYGQQLAMKQKMKNIYGVLERQFRKHFEEAKKKPGVLGDELLIRLETRLDNVVYRMGFAESRQLSRQLVTHGFLTVNGKKVDIPSYEVQVGDVIAVRKEKAEKKYITERKKDFAEKNDFPSWVQVDTKKFEGKVLTLPKRSDVDAHVDPKRVIEFYSK